MGGENVGAKVDQAYRPAGVLGEGRTDHDLLDIVVLALCAVMSGAEGWDDMEDWGVSGKRGCGATCRCATAFPPTTPSGRYSRRSPMELELRA
ncbi:MAG: transposase family protein [Propionivibrio sp.]|nr:transposase family protein [Propionivibrio sp.]